MDKVNETVSFSLEQADIGVVFVEGTGLLPNSGSAFYRVAPKSESGFARTAAQQELLADADFLRAAKIIAQPDLSGTMRFAGAQGLTEIRLHRKKSEGQYVVATEQGADGNVTISTFADYKAWLAWFNSDFAVLSEVPAANYIPPKVSLEEFMFVLHTIDSFRRVSYQNMLSHVFTDSAYVKVPDFLASMAKSLQTMDIRWLLPAFLAVTPGVEQYQTAIEAQQIAVLLQHEFFTEGKLAAGDDVLVFGEAGQIMGVEFFRSWFNSCGIELKIAGSEGFMDAEKLFLAPTILGNHLVRLEGAENGQAMVNHQVYTTEQLAIKLNELFGKAFALEAGAATVQPGAAPSPARPVPPPASAPVSNFCRNCGAKLSAGVAFCSNCGTKTV